MDPTPIISTHGLHKSFGEKTAVADLTLTVNHGEVFGFLGPNGAGKTTSVKMLLGLVHPSGGTGEMLGAPLGDPAARARAGFLPEHFRFHGWLTGAEFLRLHGQLHGIEKSVLAQRILELLDLVGLVDAGDKKLGAYSKGMLQRIGLAQALINEPELVILDEPTSGLDPFGRRLVRDIVRDLRDMGRTVFINSHLLSEIEVTCDRAAFIHQGRIVRAVDLHESDVPVVRVHARVGALGPEVLAGLAALAADVQAENGTLAFSVPDEAALPGVHRYLVEQGVDVYAFRPEKQSLEDLFVQLIGTDGGQ